MASKDQSHYRVRDEAARTGRVRLPLGNLERWIDSILSGAGFRKEQAQLVAASLVDAEARGISSHGIARARIYSERLLGGLLNGDADPSVVKETAATAHVDADNAVGHAGADKGLQAAMDKAAAEGAGVAVVRNSNHCGTLGFFARRAAERGMISILATNGPPVMVYFGGRTRAVGTNPLGIGIPRADGPPLVLDMATSATARGKIILAGQRGDDIPDGWAVDVDGRPTTDPGEALQGAVVPFAGPKGSGLAMMIDLLCGGLASAITGEDVGDMYEDWDREQRVSHFLMVLNPDAWLGGDAFRDHVTRFATRVAGLPSAEGFDRVMLPGEIEEMAMQRAREEGVAIAAQVYDDLQAFADGLGVNTPAAEDVDATPAQSS
jgi:LDH2 family malate/lactate/ureidoglycolate dehydrogenase